MKKFSRILLAAAVCALLCVAMAVPAMALKIDTSIKTPVVTAENASTGVKITWKSVADADYYQVYTSKDGKTYTRVAETAGTSYTYTKATALKKLYVKVRAVEGTSCSNCGKQTIVYVPVVKISEVNTTSYQHRMYVVMKNPSCDVDGYQVQYGRDKTFENVLGVKWTKDGNRTAIFTDLMKGGSYYVRARAWVKIGGKTYKSAWVKYKSKVTAK